MIPIVATKAVTLASGQANVDLGFNPDFVMITNKTLSSMTSGDTIQIMGKPDEGSSSGQMLGLQVDASAVITAIDIGDIVSWYNGTDFSGLSLDFSSHAGIGSTAELNVVAMRQNG